MTRILVTGAAGFIGSHLVERLVAAGHDVIGLDSFDGFLYPAAIKERNVAALAGRPDFRLVRGDLLDAALCAELAAGCERVVHLAALAGVRPSIVEPARYARANVEGTVTLLEACRAAGVRRFAFASSSSVYGARGVASAAFSEDDPCLAPASPYAATKRAGELVCRTYRDLHGIGVVALRYFTVYGPRQRPEMAIHKFTRALAARRPVPLYGDGSTALHYPDIDATIAGAFAAALAVDPGDYRIYNLGGSRTTTLRRLVELIGDALGVAPRVEHEPDQPGDVPITYADVTRACRDLGY